MIKFLILILLHTVRKIGMYGVLHILSYSLLKTLKSKSLELSNTKFTENLTVSYLEMIYFYSFPWGKFACTIYNDLKKIFFSVRVSFHGHWQLTEQQGTGRDYVLFHSTTSTHWRTLRHLFTTLHVRWLLHICNRTACIYQTATRWDLPPYRISIWLIDDVMWILIIGFCYSNLRRETGGLAFASTITLVLQANRLTKGASHRQPL